MISYPKTLNLLLARGHKSYMILDAPNQNKDIHMSSDNTTHSYGSGMKFFHWLLTILIIGMIVFGYCLDSIVDKPTKMFCIQLHKSIGLTILALMVMRLLWRWLNISPTLPKDMPLWERFVARLTHILLYVVVFMMPLSGWLASTASGYSPRFFWLFNVSAPGIANNKALGDFIFNFHVYGAYILIALLVLHILASLKHHFINKDDVLTRML